MKKLTLVILAGALCAQAYAQPSTSRTTGDQQARTGVAAEGVRMALIVPNWEAQFKASFGGFSAKSEKYNFDNIVGVSAGYAKLPIKNIGFIIDGAYFNIHESDSDNGFARLQANGALAPNEILYFKGGINISKIVTGEASDEWDAGVGFQAGLGFQLTKNLGAELVYSQMSQSAEQDGIKVEMEMTGPEVSLTGTF